MKAKRNHRPPATRHAQELLAILFLLGTLEYSVNTLAESKESLSSPPPPPTPTTTTPPSSTSSAGDSDKIDIKQLEQKYWSAKDDDFAVVQNRRYTKEKRFYVSALMGPPVSDPYATGLLYGGQFGYFFNERWGIDFQMTQSSFHDNSATDQFISEHHTTPNHNLFMGSKTISAGFFPLYAKMSFMDKAIIYFDMGISIGFGMVDYKILKQDGDELRTASSYHITVTQQIFFSEHWAMRADFINRWTNENLMRWAVVATAGSNPERDHGFKSTNDTSLLLGVTYWK